MRLADAARDVDVGRGLVDEHIEAHAGVLRVGGVELFREERGLLERDLALQRHDLVLAPRFDLGGDREIRIVLHRAGDGAFLVRVLEHAQHVEACLVDELEEALVVFLGLAREAGDEGRADGHPRDALAQAFDEVALVLRADIAAHGAQHVVARVLERDIDVLEDVGERRDGVDHLVGEGGGVGVHEAHPCLARALGDDLVDLREEHGQAAHPDEVLVVLRVRAVESDADVVAVGSGVLPDEGDLERAVGEEFLDLFEDAVDGLGAEFAADRRDGAERAALVAPLGDAQVRVVARGEAEPRGIRLEVADALAVLALDGEPDGVHAA